jgi:hypothetical protein
MKVGVFLNKKKKHKVDGLVDRYKATLIAKIYTQIYEVDQQTFSLVIKISMARAHLSLIVNLD